MTKSKNLKKNGLFLSACIVSAVVAGGVLTSYAGEIKRAVIEVDGNKPLENLGEIAEKPVLSDTSKPKLYDEDEKVGETVKLENLKRVDELGNTKKEFETFEDAEKWAEKKLEENKILSYSVFPVQWSDKKIHSYTVEAKLFEGVEMND